MNFFRNEVICANILRRIGHLVQHTTDFSSIPFFSNRRCSFIGTTNVFLGNSLVPSNRYSLGSRCNTSLFSCLGFLGFPFGSLGCLGVNRLLFRWWGNLFFRLLWNL